uniref:Peptidase S1 domain-containing protein n=1 Tax=Stegastes partitus TaxID=144197 RepID=A0A3B5AJL3_9TELE
QHKYRCFRLSPTFSFRHHTACRCPTEEVARVQRIHLHHYYDYESHDYDLALLKLDRPASVLLAGHARPACLPPPTHQLEPGLLCWVTGWGALRAASNLLQKVDVRLVSEEACVRSYGHLVTPRMLCAGYRSGEKDACNDSLMTFCTCCS